MELIATLLITVVALAGTILVASISRQLTDEFKAWTPWLTERIIRHAVSLLPTEKRERLSEEWRSHVGEIPGELGKLLIALGCLRASRQIRDGVPIVERLAAVVALSSVLPLLLVIWFALWLETGRPVLVKRPVRWGTRYQHRLLAYRFAAEGSRVGALIRRCDLDVLPVFLHVVRGEARLPSLSFTVRQVLRSLRKRWPR